MPLNLKDTGFEYCLWDALFQIALEFPIKSYLEVGSRYGDSLLRVIAGCALSPKPRRLDRITICDIWHETLFGASGSGTGFDRSHKHIERFLTAAGYQPDSVLYLDGDSRKLIPTLDRRRPYDLVLVDGDHDFDAEGTVVQDLLNCWPLVAPDGFLVFDDITSDEKMLPKFDSVMKNSTEVAARYIRTNKKFGVVIAQRESHALETSKIRNFVLPYLNGNGIDIGCSRDPITRYCVAFDRSDYPEITHRGDAASLPFEDGKFDWVYSSHCLEDFEDTEGILKEWLRVLRPGGTIALYVPHPDLYKGTNDDHKHPGFRIEELTGLLRKLECQPLMTKLDSESEPGCPRYSSLVIASKP